jgi:chlorite dismutase
MNEQHRPTTGEAAEISLIPSKGWHCTHLFYSFDRDRLSRLDDAALQQGCEEFSAALDPSADGAPTRLQASIVSGHKADFGLMLLDPDPLVVEDVHQRLLASALGPAITPAYSFVSITEISEYVPTVEQYGQRLVGEGEQEGSDSYNAKVKAYEQREVHMRRQRLTPDFPPWPATCFYPMNKWRVPGANWFSLDSAERHRLMNEHARSGMSFAGKVTQLITVGIGLDDWEWGVTLWARNPEFLKDIVYRMRFDEASAKYAEFGPFYTSYISTADEILKHCKIG